MRTSVLIDWVSATLTKAQVTDRMFDADNALPQDRGRFGYTNQNIDPNGAVLLYNEEDPTCHIQYSGACLARMREYGIDTLDLISELIDHGAKVTRLDLALDVKDSDLRIADLAKDIEAGRAITRSRSWKELKSANGGHTLYIGSRTSEIYVRVYDKSAEIKSKGKTPQTPDHIRIELELKDDTAKFAAKSLFWHDVASVLFSKLNEFVNFPNNSDWVHAVRSLTGPIKFEKSERGERDTQAWLLKSVLPSLMAECAKDPQFRDQIVALLLPIPKVMVD